MPKWLADENLSGVLLRGIRGKLPEIDAVRIQDVGLSGKSDSVVLKHARLIGRMLLSHDVRTLPHRADRLFRRSPDLPGIFLNPEKGELQRHDP